MDPTGVGESLLAEHFAAPLFRVAEALRGLWVPMRVRKSIYRAAHLPLSRSLPARLDADAEGGGLFGYDLLAFVDVDPQVLTPQEQMNVVAYVEQGGALLICGGPNSLSAATGSYALLDVAMPVSVIRGEGKRKDCVVEGTVWLDSIGAFGEFVRYPCGLHPCGVRLLPVDPKQRSEVWLEAEGEPVLVVGRYGKGRVAVWTAYASPAAWRPEPFFWGDACRNIMSELILWLMDVPERLRIVQYDPPAAQVRPGAHVRVAARSDCADAASRFTLFRDGAPIGEGAAPSAPSDLAWDEVLDYRLDLLDTNGKAHAMRTGTVYGRPPSGLVIQFPYAISVFETAGRIAFSVEGRGRLREGQVRAALHDEGGALVADLGVCDLGGDPLAAHFDTVLPELALGCYRLVVRAGRAGAQQWVAVVAPLDRDDFFLTMGVGPVSCPDPDQTFDRYTEYLSRNFTGGAGLSAERLRSVHCAPAALGQVLHVRAAISLLNLEGVDARRGSTSEAGKLAQPCVYSPAYQKAVRKRVREEMQRIGQLPRLYDAEFASGPAVAPARVCRCKYCLKAFRERYGYEMPVYADVAQAGDGRKYDLLQWIGGYVERGWDVMRQAAGGEGRTIPLSGTLTTVSLGSSTPQQGYSDAFRWSRMFDMWEMESHPRPRPGSRCAGALPMSECHYLWGFCRTLAEYRGREIGAWLDGTDRSDPVCVLPEKASREALLTSLAQGAGYVRYHCRAGGRGEGARESRWLDFADVLGRLRPVLPLLKHSRRPASQVAQIHGETHWIMGARNDAAAGGQWPSADPLCSEEETTLRPQRSGWQRYNVCEMITRAWGDCDVVHERLLETDHVSRCYRALMLSGVRWLPDALAERLVEFVRDGGLLLCDGLPTRNERGQESSVLKPLLVSGDQKWVVDDLACTLGRFAQGRVARFNRDLHEFYSSAVDRRDLEAQRRLEAVVSELLRDQGLRPLATTTDPNVEVGVRFGENFALLLAVNHAQQALSTVATVPSLPFEPRWAVDVLDGAPIAVDQGSDAPALRLDVPFMDGRVVALYPEATAGLEVAVASEVRRGHSMKYDVRVLDPDGRPARGRHAVHVQVRDARGSERPRYGGVRATLDGVLRREIPVAVNEAPGEWRIEVRDPLSRRVVSRAFHVT